MTFRRRSPLAESSSSSSSQLPYNIPGIKRWTNGIHLISSGIHALDAAIGGSLPLRSIVLIKHDQPTSNYLTWLRCFAAEGIARGHYVIKCSPTDAISNQTLPSVAEKKNKKSGSAANDALTEKLKISWRYKNLSGVQQSLPISSLDFDLNKPMPTEMLASNAPLDIALRSFSQFPISSDEYFDELLERIRTQLTLKRCLDSNGHTPLNACRVAIESIISPFLGYDPSASMRPLIRFLHSLRSLTRSAFAVCMISVPTYLMKNGDSTRLDHMFDLVLNLHSFVGGKSIYGDFDGLMKIERIPQLQTLKVNRPESDEFLFKLKKNGVLIERVSMPVEDARDDDLPNPGPTACSGAQPGGQLDF